MPCQLALRSAPARAGSPAVLQLCAALANVLRVTCAAYFCHMGPSEVRFPISCRLS